jgi:hypothetical protein
LPFQDGRFDWAITYRLFHHMQDHKNRVDLLKSIARVSRKGVLFSAWIDTPLNRRRRSRRRCLSRNEMARVAEEAALSLTKVDYAFWPFQPKCVITCKKQGHLS